MNRPKILNGTKRKILPNTGDLHELSMLSLSGAKQLKTKSDEILGKFEVAQGNPSAQRLMIKVPNIEERKCVQYPIIAKKPTLYPFVQLEALPAIEERECVPIIATKPTHQAFVQLDALPNIENSIVGKKPLQRPFVRLELFQSPTLPSNRTADRIKKAKLYQQFLDRDVSYAHTEKYNSTDLSIGKGTYGAVFKGYEVKTHKAVAIKQMTFRTNVMHGICWNEVVYREIKSLQSLQEGENIVKLLDICRRNLSASSQQYDLVFEYCPHDLGKMMRCKNVDFKLADIKSLLRQLFTGMEYIHSQNVMHRDIKPDNILLTSTGILKIADLGLARLVTVSPITVSTTQPTGVIEYTNNVVTMHYRPPEILLGDRKYTAAVDIWSAGCVMVEFWSRKPIMAGETEQQQLKLISDLCGSITPDVWPNVSDLNLYGKIQLPMGHERKLLERVGQHVNDENALNLLDNLLQLNPLMRLDDEGALDHDFFWFDPLPSNLKYFMEQLKTVKWDNWHK